jgi:hypothetical protein
MRGAKYRQDPTIKVKKSVKSKLEHLDFVKFGMTRNRIITRLIDFYNKKHIKKQST